jgi:transposase InsO family protein
LREYAAVQRERYQQAPRTEKHQLLDEVVAVTGLHRKAAIRLLRRVPRARAIPGPGGRPRRYGPDVAVAAEVLWQASGRIGAHRLQPFVPELLDRLLLCGELTITPPVDKLLRQISRPTLARLLAPARAQYPVRGATITRPSHLRRQEIPIRTFTDWDDARPGFLEIDLVAHCGSSTQGFYLCTLCAVDITTAWIELDAVWGKNQSRVASAVHRVRQRLPVPLVGLDSDNGSEFINRHLLAWCRRHGITFTRSRAWKKNDNAHVEQKNGAIVRHLIGYDRFVSRAAWAQLQHVYDLVRLHINFFQPVQKLVTKTRHGARAHRVYDRAQTPYQRLCAAGVLTPAKQTELEQLYQTLNPLRLRRDLDAALDRLWPRAAPEPHRRPPYGLAPSPLASPGDS